MAIVPPGNKQIGDYAMSVTIKYDSGERLMAMGGLAVTKDVNDATVVKPPLNLQVGDYAMSVTINCGNTGRLLSSAGLCVAKYTPPAQGNLLAMGGLVVATTPTDLAGLPPRNLQVGDYTMSLIINTPNATRLLSMAGVVVVQQITKRIETILMEIYHPSGV